MPTTGGIPQFADVLPERNAVAVQRLIDAGAIVFGKTNLPLLAMDWQSYNEIYGTTNNPWDLGRTPGGSSGGSAAALAAGLTALELGSDIGGSIRIPAHYTGVYGHKPTFGLVSRAGQFPMFPPLANDVLSVAGPMSRDAADLELALDVLIAAGDAGGAPVVLPPARADRLEDYRVAVWLEDSRLPTDHEVLDVLEELVSKLRDAGVLLDEDARPDVTLAQSYAVDIQILIGITNFLPIPPERFVEQEEIRRKWDGFFERYDVVLCPTAQTVAIPHDPSPDIVARRITVNGRPWSYSDQGVWISLATLAGLPATVAPVGLSSSGLPVGVQIIGPRLGDRTTIGFARHLENLVGGFVAPPEA
jgi:amidase